MSEINETTVDALVKSIQAAIDRARAVRDPDALTRRVMAGIIAGGDAERFSAALNGVARRDRSVTSQPEILDRPLASGFESQRDQPTIDAKVA